MVIDLVNPDSDNLYPKSGSHHVSNGRWFGRTEEEFYSPTQPRGEDGKWKLSGSGSVAPSPVATSVRRAYLAAGGVSESVTDYSDVRVPIGLRARTARMYSEMAHDDPSAHGAYAALAQEVHAQFEHMRQLGIKVQVVDNDPYADVSEMVADVNTNRTLKVLSSSSTGGHPLFSDDTNDKFRAVHDFFGHAATGRDFGRHGERATYLAHASTMKNPDAVRALYTETEAQNAWLIKNKAFGPQKIGLLPDDMVFQDVERRSIVASVYEEFARTRKEQMRRRSSGKSIGGRDPSLRWPHLYDILRAKGHDKEAAARISNAHLRKRKKGRLQGLPWQKADNKRALKKLVSSSSLVASAYTRATSHVT